MRLIILGPPGAGKGTQSGRIAAHYGIPAISTGDIFRANIAGETALGLQVKGILSAGGYVPDEVTNAIVEDRIAQDDCLPGFLLDGYPRTLPQVAALDEMLSAHGQSLERVLELVVDEDIVVSRLLARAQVEGRSDDTEEVIRDRMAIYHRETAPLAKTYADRGLLVQVDGPGRGRRGHPPRRDRSRVMGLFSRERIQGKSPEQILAMRAAGLVVARALELLGEHVHDGITTGELDHVAERAIRDAGAVPSFPLVPGYHHTLCTSVNEEIVHGIPGGRVLHDGDLVSIDCGAVLDGWHGDAAISLVVGGREAARPEDLALLDDTEDSLWAGIGALAVGRPLYAVGAAVEDSLAAAGERRGRSYGIVEDYVGHGIGTEMHMDPQVPNYRVPGKGPQVISGTTVAIEPMVTLGAQDNDVLDDDWTVVTLDGSRAAHWEHTVAVTDEGLWVLTALDGGQARLAAAGAAYAPLT